MTTFEARKDFVFSEELERTAARILPGPAGAAFSSALQRVQHGCFQRSLCFVVAVTSIASGLEVSYEHYKGSYSNPVMYTPVVLSATLAAAGFLGVASRRGATVILRTVSAITLADGIIGFFFHVRGIGRKPGGWSLPVTNIVMGPPIFAPLLFGTSAYLGWMASHLRREEDYGNPLDRLQEFQEDLFARKLSWRENLHHGRFQKHLAGVTILWAIFSGLEALYSHYKTNFRSTAQWTPILLTPLLVAAAVGAIRNRRTANTVLPAISALALADGAAGFYYHARGVLRRPGGKKKLAYNTLYGPPIFAPLLFAACGFLGIMASLLRRERE